MLIEGSQSFLQVRAYLSLPLKTLFLEGDCTLINLFIGKVLRPFVVSTLKGFFSVSSTHSFGSALPPQEGIQTCGDIEKPLRVETEGRVEHTEKNSEIPHANLILWQ